MGLSRAPFGSSLGAFGRSEGPLDPPKRASRYILELSWAWFARLLLPKMALGAFWGCLWLVLGAPESLLGGGGLASVKPISTVKTAFPSFDTLFYFVLVLVVVLLLRLLVLVLVLVPPLLVRVRVLVLALALALLLALVLVLALVLALVLVVVVSLLPCNFSSIRLGGMRGAIE